MEKFCLQKEITVMEMDGIPPGTHVNGYEVYDIMLEVRNAAEILLPLHEPKFASEDTIG